MGKVEEFLSKKEEEEIVKAIQKAEQNTSGEIRVHIENSAKINYVDRTHEVFRMLKMEKTKQRNGVLIYIAVEDKHFEIYGDKGINDVASSDFWNSTCQIMQTQFREGNFKQGIIDGVLQVGEELKSHFPYDKKTDTNELPNEVSRG